MTGKKRLVAECEPPDADGDGEEHREDARQPHADAGDEDDAEPGLEGPRGEFRIAAGAEVVGEEAGDDGHDDDQREASPDDGQRDQGEEGPLRERDLNAAQAGRSRLPFGGALRVRGGVAQQLSHRHGGRS